MNFRHALWLLGIALVCLKLTKLITISWLIVVLPFLIGPAITLLVLAFGALLVGAALLAAVYAESRR